MWHLIETHLVDRYVKYVLPCGLLAEKGKDISHFGKYELLTVGRFSRMLKPFPFSLSQIATFEMATYYIGRYASR